MMRLCPYCGTKFSDSDVHIIFPETGIRCCASCGTIENDRNRIAADHMRLCHGDGTPCLDGCSVAADPEALKEYLNEDEESSNWKVIRED
jgi:hypothetical protein